MKQHKSKLTNRMEARKYRNKGSGKTGGNIWAHYVLCIKSESK